MPRISLVLDWERQFLRAAARHDPRALARLLKAVPPSADLSARSGNGWSAFHFAADCRNAQAAEMLRLLLTAGAPADLRARGGVRPLHLAAQSGRADAVIMLLAAGASAQLADDSGSSPLHAAASRGSAAAAAALLARGACVDAVDALGRTPAHAAAGSAANGSAGAAVLCTLLRAPGGAATLTARDSVRGDNAAHSAAAANDVHAMLTIVRCAGEPSTSAGDAVNATAGSSAGHSRVWSMWRMADGRLLSAPQAMALGLHVGAAAASALNGDGRTPADVARALGFRAAATAVRRELASQRRAWLLILCALVDEGRAEPLDLRARESAKRARLRTGGVSSLRMAMSPSAGARAAPAADITVVSTTALADATAIAAMEAALQKAAATEQAKAARASRRSPLAALVAAVVSATRRLSTPSPSLRDTSGSSSAASRRGAGMAIEMRRLLFSGAAAEVNEGSEREALVTRRSPVPLALTVTTAEEDPIDSDFLLPAKHAVQSSKQFVPLSALGVGIAAPVSNNNAASDAAFAADANAAGGGCNVEENPAETDGGAGSCLALLVVSLTFALPTEVLGIVFSYL